MKTRRVFERIGQVADLALGAEGPLPRHAQLAGARNEVYAVQQLHIGANRNAQRVGGRREIRAQRKILQVVKEREHRVLGRAGDLERNVDLAQRQRVGGPFVDLEDVQSERRLDGVRSLTEGRIRGRLGQSRVEGAHRTLAHETPLHAGDGVRGLRHRHLGEILASPYAVREGGGPFAGGERIGDRGSERDTDHVDAGAGGPDEFVHAFVIDLPDFTLRNGDL
ncbi:MAG: hypothetical protein F4X22_12460 [Gemmatimonadales bacterium]|nr:hypothetical protein [Candidatus Palauibacter denitrificans]